MTQDEVERIVKLQKMGFGYKKISSLTGININSVKSHCRRNPVEVTGKPVSDIFCKGCGMPITKLEKRKLRQFCSDAYLMKWWNSNCELVSLCSFFGYNIDITDKRAKPEKAAVARKIFEMYIKENKISRIAEMGEKLLTFKKIHKLEKRLDKL